MPVQPDLVLMRAVADVVVTEEKARVAADQELAADVARLREHMEKSGDIVPIERTLVPPELAEQIMAATRMLEVPPPIREIAPPVERVIGPPGERGLAGRDGADGAKGDEGPPGRDGISITAAAINRDGELMLTLSNGTVLTPGRVEGRGA
jgi:hypothetical protein